MKKALALAILAAASFVVATDAQQAGHNTPVLPGTPADPNATDAHLKSDLLQQGQVENSIVVSTRDWSNIGVAFNDYRKVHISDTETPGGTEIAANRPGRLERFLAWLTGRRIKQPAERRAASPNEASIGLAFSYDGGLTFTGAVLQPIENLDAMSDPHWAAAPCGVGYLALIAFDRGAGGRSVIAVIKYEDVASPGGDSWTNRGYSIVDEGISPIFHDLPWIIVDPVRTPTGDPCAHNVYVGWARFSSDTESVMRFARSTDGGQTWIDKKTIAAPVKAGQRAVIDVDRRPGRPQTGGGGTVYYGFRSFKASPSDPAPPGFWVAHSINFGGTFTPAFRINTSAVYPFDQPAIGMNDDPTGGTQLAFRTNAFMSLQSVPISAGVSRLFAAWSQRSVMPPNPPATGPCPATPNPNGSPLVFYTYSDDHGRTWRPAKPLDCGRRDVGTGAPAPGFGFLPQPRDAGPQFQPHLSFGGGRLGAFYYESRHPLTPVNVDGTPQLLITRGSLGNHIDARFALIDPGTQVRIPSLAGTNQVSRYPVKFQANLNNGEGVDDIYEVVDGVPAINKRGTEPTRKDGTTPFIGDYPGAVPVVSLVPVRNTSGTVTSWKWAINAADVPFQGFRVGFTDSRNQIPADLDDYPSVESGGQYAPPACPSCDPAIPPPSACNTAGSRNLDVIHALVDARVGLNAASTFEPTTQIARNFPITITNGTGSFKTYRVTLTNLTPAGTVASFDQDDGISNANQAVTKILVALFAYSSTTRVVTLKSADAAASVRVNLVEVTCSNVNNLPEDPDACGATPGGETASATLNLDPTTPIAASDDETHAPGVKGPGVKGYTFVTPGVKGDALNPGVKGPGVKGPGVKGDSLSDALVQNPTLDQRLAGGTESVHEVIDVTWEVTSGGTDAASLLSHFNIENPQGLDKHYVFHLLIHRQSAFAALDTNDCSTKNGFLDQVVSSIPMSPLNGNVLINNPGVKGDALSNPGVKGPGVKGAQLTNATFAVAPTDQSTSTAGASAMRASLMSRPSSPGGSRTDPSILAAPLSSSGDDRDVYRDVVFVTFRAYRMKHLDAIPDNEEFHPEVNPPAILVDSIINDTIDGTVITDPTLYAVTFGEQLIAINTATGVGTLIGSLGAADMNPFGLASFNGTLYTFDQEEDRIKSINHSTGATIATYNISVGNVTGEGSLAFRSDGVGFLSASSGGVGTLWSFDVTGPEPFSNPITATNGLTPSMDGLEFDPEDVLIGLDQSTPSAGSHRLYTIDQTNGGTENLGAIGVQAGGQALAGLAFRHDGVLFAVINNVLYRIDFGDGAFATQIGTGVGFSNISGVTFRK